MRIAQHHDWIAELPVELRKQIRARMTTTSFRPGDVIAQMGMPAVAVHQVVNGYVKILKQLPSGDQVLLGLFIPGNWFSESAVVDERNHHHTTIAATQVTLAVLAKADFEQLYKTYPQIPEALSRKVVRVMSLILENRETIALHNVRTQVALVFCNLAENCAAETDSVSRIILVPLTISDVANFLSVSRQTVQKEVSYFKGEGLLEKKSGKWLVSDLRQLRALTNTAGS